MRRAVPLLVAGGIGLQAIAIPERLAPRGQALWDAAPAHASLKKEDDPCPHSPILTGRPWTSRNHCSGAQADAQRRSSLDPHAHRRGRDRLLYQSRHLRDALCRRAGHRPQMRAVLTLFEGVATGAADGYARMTDTPAATLLHLGPGLGNGLANLHNARRAKVPIVNIVGDHATYHVPYDAQLQSDIETVARNVSAWVRTCQSTQELGRDAVEAIAAALEAAGPGRHPDPACRHLVGRRRRARPWHLRHHLRPRAR
jgi:Thiamine pyrophosphate enzyme, N-terminal TPP binding domain